MSNAKSQEQVWNKIAEKWKQYRTTPSKEVLEFLKDKKGKILDLGCGSGRNMIKQDGLEYYGVDFSDKMLNYAKKKAESLQIKAQLKKSEASKIDFDDEFFDYAIFISTLHCIEVEKLRRKALAELYRTLKIGGIAMITVWDKDSNDIIKENGAKEGFVNWKKDGVNYPRYYYFYDKDELLYLLRDIGFEILETTSQNIEEKDKQHSKKNIIIYVRKS